MQKKKLKKRKFKIASLLFMCVAAVMMLCTMLSTNVYAATDTATTTTTSKDSYVPEDPTIYDTNWSKANVKHWLTDMEFLWVDETVSYIRITDKNGLFINEITRLEACYTIEGKGNRHVNRELQYVEKWNELLDLDDDGYLMTWEEWTGVTTYFPNTYKECNKKFDDFRSCNYVWLWNEIVTEIVYLYVWYLDPITGEEVAASFCPNGEHPKYDSEGKLTGIYNTEGELLEQYTLNEKGIPSMIATDGTLNPVLTPEDQLVDYSSMGNLLDMLNPFVSNDSNDFNFMNVIYIMAAIFVGLLLLAILIAIITWIFKIVRGKK